MRSLSSPTLLRVLGSGALEQSPNFYNLKMRGVENFMPLRHEGKALVFKVITSSQECLKGSPAGPFGLGKGMGQGLLTVPGL